MNTAQLIQTVVAALIIAAIIGLARLVAGKADQKAVAEFKSAMDKDFLELKGKIDSKAEKVELNRVESEAKASVAKNETKLDAALLIVGTVISRPELAEKLQAMAGRSDDRMARVLADIVQINTDLKANAKVSSDTDKRLDDLPGRVRSLEEDQKRN